jgi:hypothetical protein
MLSGVLLFVMTQIGAVTPFALSTADAQPSTGEHQVALGIYQPSFPDDLSGLSGYEQATGHPASIVHWYTMWGGWKSAFSLSDLEPEYARRCASLGVRADLRFAVSGR